MKSPQSQYFYSNSRLSPKWRQVSLQSQRLTRGHRGSLQPLAAKKSGTLGGEVDVVSPRMMTNDDKWGYWDYILGLNN